MKISENLEGVNFFTHTVYVDMYILHMLLRLMDMHFKFSMHIQKLSGYS